MSYNNLTADSRKVIQGLLKLDKQLDDAEATVSIECGISPFNGDTVIDIKSIRERVVTRISKVLPK